MNYICRNILKNNNKSSDPIKQCELCGEFHQEEGLIFITSIGWICLGCFEDFINQN